MSDVIMSSEAAAAQSKNAGPDHVIVSDCQEVATNQAELETPPGVHEDSILTKLRMRSALRSSDNKPVSASRNKNTATTPTAKPVKESVCSDANMAEISIGNIIRSFLASVEAVATIQDDFRVDGATAKPSDQLQFAGCLAAVKATIDSEPHSDFRFDAAQVTPAAVTADRASIGRPPAAKDVKTEGKSDSDEAVWPVKNANVAYVRIRRLTDERIQSCGVDAQIRPTTIIKEEPTTMSCLRLREDGNNVDLEIPDVSVPEASASSTRADTQKQEAAPAGPNEVTVPKRTRQGALNKVEKIDIAHPDKLSEDSGSTEVFSDHMSSVPVIDKNKLNDDKIVKRFDVGQDIDAYATDTQSQDSTDLKPVVLDPGKKQDHLPPEGKVTRRGRPRAVNLTKTISKSGAPIEQESTDEQTKLAPKNSSEENPLSRTETSSDSAEDSSVGQSATMAPKELTGKLSSGTSPPDSRAEITADTDVTPKYDTRKPRHGRASISQAMEDEMKAASPKTARLTDVSKTSKSDFAAKYATSDSQRENNKDDGNTVSEAVIADLENEQDAQPKGEDVDTSRRGQDDRTEGKSHQKLEAKSDETDRTHISTEISNAASGDIQEDIGIACELKIASKAEVTIDEHLSTGTENPKKGTSSVDKQTGSGHGREEGEEITSEDLKNKCDTEVKLVQRGRYSKSTVVGDASCGSKTTGGDEELTASRKKEPTETLSARLTDMPSRPSNEVGTTSKAGRPRKTKVGEPSAENEGDRKGSGVESTEENVEKSKPGRPRGRPRKIRPAEGAQKSAEPATCSDNANSFKADEVQPKKRGRLRVAKEATLRPSVPTKNLDVERAVKVVSSYKCGRYSRISRNIIKGHVKRVLTLKRPLVFTRTKQSASLTTASVAPKNVGRKSKNEPGEAPKKVTPGDSAEVSKKIIETKTELEDLPRKRGRPPKKNKPPVGGGTAGTAKQSDEPLPASKRKGGTSSDTDGRSSSPLPDIHQGNECGQSSGSDAKRNTSPHRSQDQGTVKEEAATELDTDIISKEVHSDTAEEPNKATVMPKRGRGRPPLSEEERQARLTKKLALKGRMKKNVLKVALRVLIRPRTKREQEDKKNDISASEAPSTSATNHEQLKDTTEKVLANEISQTTGDVSKDADEAKTPSTSGASADTSVGLSKVSKVTPEKPIVTSRSPQETPIIKVPSKKQAIRVSRGSDTDTAEETLNEEEHLEQLEDTQTLSSTESCSVAPKTTTRAGEMVAVKNNNLKEDARGHVSTSDIEQPQAKKQKKDDEEPVSKVPLLDAPTIVEGKRERKRKVMDDFEGPANLIGRATDDARPKDVAIKSAPPPPSHEPPLKKKSEVIVVTPHSLMSAAPVQSSHTVKTTPVAIAPKLPTTTVNVVVPPAAAPPLVVQPKAGVVGPQSFQVQMPMTVSVPIQFQSSSGGPPRPMVITVPANGLRPPIAGGIMKTLVMNKVHRAPVSSASQSSGVRLPTSSVTTTATSSAPVVATKSPAPPRIQVVPSQRPAKVLSGPVRPPTAAASSHPTSASSLVMRPNTLGARPVSSSTGSPSPRVITALIRPSIIRGPRYITSVNRPGAPRMLAPVGAGHAQPQSRVVTLRPTTMLSHPQGHPAGTVQTIRQGAVTMLPRGKLVVRTLSPTGNIVSQRPLIQQRQITVQATPSPPPPPPPPTTVVFTSTANVNKTTPSILVTRSPTVFSHPLGGTTVRSIGPPKCAPPSLMRTPATTLHERSTPLVSTGSVATTVSTMSTTTRSVPPSTIADQQHAAVGQQLVTVHRRQPVLPVSVATTAVTISEQRKQPLLPMAKKSPFVPQAKTSTPKTPPMSPSVPIAPVIPVQSKPIDESSSAAAKLLQEPELPQPKLSKKPLTKKQKSMRKTDLIKTSTRSRRRGTDIDYNEDRMGVLPVADSETDSQEASLPSEEVGGSPGEPVEEPSPGQPVQDDIPVAVVEVFLSQDEVKLRDVHSPTKQDLADISQQQQQETQNQQTGHSIQDDQGPVVGGQGAPEGFYTTEEGFVETDQLHTIVESVVCSSSSSHPARGYGLVSSNDNAFAKALMSSDTLLAARRKPAVSFAGGSSSKRKSNPMSRD